MWAASFLLTNVDNLIQGEGNLGLNETQFINQAAGVVNANVNGRVLTVDPGANGFANQGLLAASNGGVLLLTGNGGGAFNNSGGIIRADGGEVQLSSLVAINGGNLESLNGGLIRVLTSDAIFSQPDPSRHRRVRQRR